MIWQQRKQKLTTILLTQRGTSEMKTVVILLGGKCNKSSC